MVWWIRFYGTKLQYMGAYVIITITVVPKLETNNNNNDNNNNNYNGSVSRVACINVLWIHDVFTKRVR